jgi:hypothetical protein
MLMLMLPLLLFFIVRPLLSLALLHCARQMLLDQIQPHSSGFTG